MIRPANLLDIPRIVELGQIMHAESEYADLDFNAPKLARVIAATIEQPNGLAIVATKAGIVIGAFMGVRDAFFFSDAEFSFDLATFIDPAERGGFAAVRLLHGYIDWAKECGVVRINAGIASGINHDLSVRLYERIGFERNGVSFVYKGDH